MSMWMLLWMKRETIGPAAAAIVESLICWANLLAAASSASRNVTCGGEPTFLVASSLPTPSSLADFGPTPAVTGSFSVTATVPSARFWRTYSTPPSSLTLTSRMLTEPLRVSLSVASATTHWGRAGLRPRGAWNAADLADQLLGALGALPGEPAGAHRRDDRGD